VELVVEFMQELWKVVGPAVPVFLVFLGYWLAARQERISTSYQRHTDDLKNLGRQWSVQIKPIPEARDPPELEPSLLHLPVESEYLFSDLKSHIPKDLKLISMWESFKKLLLEYNRGRFHLYQEIIDDTKKRTGLPYDPHSSNSPTIGRRFGERWYSEVFMIVMSPEFTAHDIDIQMESAGSGLFTLESQGNILARVRGEPEAMAVKSVLKEMFNGLPNSPYLDQARQLMEQEKYRASERQAVLTMINEFISLPLVKGECRYIKRSI
jgi:hypothetical protein